MFDFEQAIVEEYEPLRKFAMKLTSNHSNADDLVQETICRCLEKRHLYQHDQRLFSWCSKVMYNLFVSGYRRATRFETQYDPEVYINSQVYNDDPDDKIQINRILRAVKYLPPAQRGIFKLFTNGYSYEEISDTLFIPVGTVRSRIARARENIEKIIQHEAVK